MAVVDKPLLYEDRVTHRRVAVSIIGSHRDQISFEVAIEYVGKKYVVGRWSKQDKI